VLGRPSESAYALSAWVRSVGMAVQERPDSRYRRYWSLIFGEVDDDPPGFDAAAPRAGGLHARRAWLRRGRGAA